MFETHRDDYRTQTQCREMWCIELCLHNRSTPSTPSAQNWLNEGCWRKHLEDIFIYFHHVWGFMEKQQIPSIVMVDDTMVSAQERFYGCLRGAQEFVSTAMPRSWNGWFTHKNYWHIDTLLVNHLVWINHPSVHLGQNMGFLGCSLVNQHNHGKSQFLRGKSSIDGDFQ